MSSTTDLPQQPHQIVAGALERLSEAFGARDVEAAVDCFSPDGAVYGDDLGEHAHGAEELRPFLAELFEEAFTITWETGATGETGESGGTWSRRRGDVLWFVSEAEAVLDYPDGLRERVRFQLSGILSATDGRWRFELFNGAQPVSPSRELLVRAG
ncbi:nuclear transport factor 2 family protein [Nocardioides sp. 31GB23]|uniref:YybH family protein n=1 Tax=Nocardioides sp. 31GB23 TaxID=3156065 RepID=UPI0032AF8FB2